MMHVPWIDQRFCCIAAGAAARHEGEPAEAGDYQPRQAAAAAAAGPSQPTDPNLQHEQPAQPAEHQHAALSSQHAAAVQHHHRHRGGDLPEQVRPGQADASQSTHGARGPQAVSDQDVHLLPRHGEAVSAEGSAPAAHPRGDSGELNGLVHAQSTDAEHVQQQQLQQRLRSAAGTTQEHGLVQEQTQAVSWRQAHAVGSDDAPTPGGAAPATGAQASPATEAPMQVCVASVLVRVDVPKHDIQSFQGFGVEPLVAG